MSLLGTFTKQPSEVKDYDIDYSEFLTAGDNVESTVVTVSPVALPLPLTVDSTFINDPRVKIWLSGGTVNTTYKVTVTTTTADGRVQQDEFRVKIKDF